MRGRGTRLRRRISLPVGLSGALLALWPILGAFGAPTADGAGAGQGGTALAAQPLPEGLTLSPSAEVGLSAEGLARATGVLQAHVDAGAIAGVVAAVVRDGRLVYLQALGSRDLEQRDAMPPDALFRLYSMTRPVTSLAILMLRDDGLLELDDPVRTYLPRFSGQRVLSAPGATDPSDSRPREGDVTLGQLLTHTAGIGSRSASLYRDREVHRWDRSLEEVVDAAAALPLFEEPGTRFRYGMSTEVLGRVIEVVSGQSLESFLQERIFGPLGMTDTGFHVESSRRPRLATLYRPGPDGVLAPFALETIPVTERRPLVSAGVGLVGSTLDVLRFSQFFLDGGVVEGRRLLSPEGVRLAAENGVPRALLPLGERGYWAGSGWTMGGMAVVLDPEAYGHIVNRGEYWWDGSAGTRFWVDPVENMVTIVMAQVSPAGGGGFREEFKSAVYRAIVDSRAAPSP